MDDVRCGLCGEPMPEGEEMFNYHGYSGPCPKPPLAPAPEPPRPMTEGSNYPVDGSNYFAHKPSAAPTAYVNHHPVDGPTCKVCGATVVGEKCLSCGEAVPTPATPLKGTGEGSEPNEEAEFGKWIGLGYTADFYDGAAQAWGEQAKRKESLRSQLAEARDMRKFQEQYSKEDWEWRDKFNEAIMRFDARYAGQHYLESAIAVIDRAETAERALATAQARIARLSEVLKEDLIMLAGVLREAQGEIAPKIYEEIQKAHHLTMAALSEPQPGEKP